MQMICFNSISDTSMLKPVCSYVLLKLAMLWGWRCCQSCFCWTASCWDWSEVERRFIRGDTQFAGMIKPARRKQFIKVASRRTHTVFYSFTENSNDVIILSQWTRFHTQTKWILNNWTGPFRSSLTPQQYYPQMPEHIHVSRAIPPTC